MTEAEWMASHAPETMVFDLKRIARERQELVSYRKAILFAVNFYRQQVGPSPDPLAQAVADAAGAFADGLNDYEPIERLCKEVEKKYVGRSKNWFGIHTDGWETIAFFFIVKILSVSTPGISAEQRANRGMKAIKWAIDGARMDSGKGKAGNQRKQAERSAARTLAGGLRDIFGNPFRPVAIDPRWLTWDGRVIPALARGIYEDSAFNRLPILADALEDAGCDNPTILEHCRGIGPHVRGCWVVDLLLGKQ